MLVDLLFDIFIQIGFYENRFTTFSINNYSIESPEQTSASQQIFVAWVGLETKKTSEYNFLSTNG